MTTNTESSIVTTAIVAAIVGGAAVYLLRPRKLTGPAPRSGPLPNPASIRSPLDEHHSLIYLDVDDNGNCTSFTFPPWGSVNKNGKVMWRVIATKDARKCLKNRKLMLIEKTQGSSPLDPAEPSGSTNIQAKAVKLTGGHRYGYEVWIVEQNGSKVERLEDPELEVVDVR